MKFQTKKWKLSQKANSATHWVGLRSRYFKRFLPSSDFPVSAASLLWLPKLVSGECVHVAYGSMSGSHSRPSLLRSPTSEEELTPQFPGDDLCITCRHRAESSRSLQFPVVTRGIREFQHWPE